MHIPLRVLFVGESLGSCSLSERVRTCGCQCQFVPSCFEGVQLASKSSFDLVLCGGRVKGFHDLLNAAKNSGATLFRYVLVEDGCWLLPTLIAGEPCLSAPALREAELSQVLLGLESSAATNSPHRDAASTALAP
jgi:hypothetical protein